MKIKIKYSQSIISLPEEPLEASLSELTEGEMKVLLYLFIAPDFRADPESCRAKAVKELDMQWDDIDTGLKRLFSHGVIELPEENVQDITHTKKAKANVRADSPAYTKEETAEIINRSDELKLLIDKSSRSIGKILSTGEVTTLVSMYDYLHMSTEFIIRLIDFCVSIDKSSLRYIERMAYSMFDLDITTVPQLEIYLAEEKKKNDIIMRIRKLFGIGERAFTVKEKKLLEAWLDTYKFTYEIIELAYELTVSAINEPSLYYAGAIMKKWYENGCRTFIDVQNETKKLPVNPSVKKNKGKSPESFDADEFMNLALQNSYPKDNG